MFKKFRVFLYLITFLTTIGCSSIIENAIPEITIVGDPEIIEIKLPSSVTIPIIGIEIGAGDEKGKLVMRLPVEAYNPNPSPLSIRKIEYDFYLVKDLIATGIQDNRVDIDSEGRSRFDLDVTVPIDKALAASPTLISFITGTPQQVRVNARVTFDILGITEISVSHEIFNQVISAPPISLPL